MVATFIPPNFRISFWKKLSKGHIQYFTKLELKTHRNGIQWNQNRRRSTKIGNNSKNKMSWNRIVSKERSHQLAISSNREQNENPTFHKRAVLIFCLKVFPATIIGTDWISIQRLEFWCRRHLNSDPPRTDTWYSWLRFEKVEFGNAGECWIWKTPQTQLSNINLSKRNIVNQDETDIAKTGKAPLNGHASEQCYVEQFRVVEKSFLIGPGNEWWKRYDRRMEIMVGLMFAVNCSWSIEYVTICMEQ